MLQKIRIATRLILGFSLLNIIIIGLNLFTLSSTGTISKAVDNSLHSSTNEVTARAFLEDLAKTRTYVWMALATGDQSKWEKAVTSIKKTSVDLGDLQNTTVNTERKEKLDQMANGLGDYIVVLQKLQLVGGSNQNLAAANVKESLRSGAEAAAQVDQIGENLIKQYNEASQEKNEVAKKTISSIDSMTTIIGVLSVIFGLALSFFISHSIVAPIKKMTAVMGELANGNLVVKVPSLENKDEIGEMAKAVEIFKENAVQVEALRQDQEHATARSAQENKKAMENMAKNFEESIMGIVKEVSASASEMHITAQNMSAAAEKSTKQASEVASASEQTTANVQTVASAAEELTASINEITHQVGQAAEIANKASTETHRADQMVQDLAVTSEKIGSVVKLINAIASQTNLLALNATIEAARAGESGRGFAVVAAEVKNLAKQTSLATEEISAQIAAVQEGTKNAVGAIHNIGGIIDQVRQISSSIAVSVEQQGSATQEIARNVQQASAGTQQVSRAIETVTETATTTGTAAKQVLDSAGELAQDADKLHSEIVSFLQKVRQDKKEYLMEWNDDLKIGIGSIDQQHRKLVDMLNELYDGFQKGVGKQVIGIVLDGLIKYTATHFKYEEEIFDRTGYAETVQHKREHEALVKRVVEIQAKFKSNSGDVLSQDVMVFLRNWLTNHIQGTDRKYAPHMKAKGIK